MGGKMLSAGQVMARARLRRLPLIAEKSAAYFCQRRRINDAGSCAGGVTFYHAMPAGISMIIIIASGNGIASYREMSHGHFSRHFRPRIRMRRRRPLDDKLTLKPACHAKYSLNKWCKPVADMQYAA